MVIKYLVKGLFSHSELFENMGFSKPMSRTQFILGFGWIFQPDLQKNFKPFTSDKMKVGMQQASVAIFASVELPFTELASLAY